MSHQDTGDGGPAQPPPPPPSQQQPPPPGDGSAVVTGSSVGDHGPDESLPPALTAVNVEHSPVSGGGGGDGEGRGEEDSPVLASAGSSPADSTESMGDDNSTGVRQYPSSSRETRGGGVGRGRGGVGGVGVGGGGALEEGEEEEDEDRQLKDRGPADDGR